MSVAEPPFSEDEQRYFLAEILKKSPLPPLHLAKFIEDVGITPSWNQMALPLGRSVAACAETFDLLRARLTSNYPTSYQTLGRPEYQATPPKPRKRPVPSGDVSTTADRTIQPRVPSFAAINDPNDPSNFTSAPVGTGEPPKKKKKRGRPSKAEHEIRAAEAAARGEPYPPPKKPRTPRPSAQGAVPTVNIFTPVVAGPAEVVEGSTGKRSARPKKTKQGASRNTSLEATTNTVDQMQPEFGAASGSTAPETQAPSQLEPENLLVGLQEHAALAGLARPVEQESMDIEESGGASEQQRDQQQEQQPERQTATDFRAYETHQ